MKKIIALITLTTAAFAGEIVCEPTLHYSYNYGSIGLGPLPIPAPTFGLGRRIMTGDRFAVDVGAEVATLVRINAVKGYVNGLMYFNQKPRSQYYMGLGGSVGGIFGPSKFCLEGYAAPNLIFGKEFCTCKGSKQFFQVEVKYPIYLMGAGTFINWGLINLKYGFAF